jgi:hypothetical protein
MQRLGLSQRALAEKLAISRGQVMQSPKLLELPGVIQDSIDAAAAVQKLQAALKRARAELARARTDAA